MSDTPSYDDLLHELGNENRKQRKISQELELRLAEAEKIIEQVQEIIRLTDCPEGYETSCMECEESKSCGRSLGIDLCLDAKKALRGVGAGGGG